MTVKRFCNELSGHNIFVPLLHTANNETIANHSIVILASRMDSFSFFYDLAPGADTVYTSLITLLAVSKTLATHKEMIIEAQKNMTDKRNVLFSLFDGEAWGYIGSSNAVYMMKNNRFPDAPRNTYYQAQIGLNHIRYFIELSQLAAHNSANLWIHKDAKQNTNEDQLIERIKAWGAKYGLIIKSPLRNNETSLPPASLQSFLKADPKIAGVVITNHEKQFTNKFYNSFYDTYSNIEGINSSVDIVQHLAKVSQMMTSVIYSILTDKNRTFDAEEDLIRQIVDCFLKNVSCTLFREMFPPEAKFKGIVVY